MSKSLLKYMSADEGMFGPGTDLIIKLLGVVIMMFAIQQKKIGDSVVYVQDNQAKFISEVSQTFSTIVEVDSIQIDSNRKEKVYKISTTNISHEKDTISIRNDAIIQRCFFGNNILFTKGDYNLSNNGTKVIEAFGKVLKKNHSIIKEIQIQGHADSDNPENNIKLSFDRANEVFNVLKDNKIGISTYENLISVVSYGDSKPVERDINDSTWNRNKHWAANYGINETGKSKKSINRRIEIVLIYREKRHNNFIK